MRRKPSQVPVSNDISKIVNLQNAKYISSVLMIIFSIYHISITLKLDDNSCKYLLMDGHYLSNYDWQPYGCMMHNYTAKDSQLCFNYIAFWGGRNQISYLGDAYLHQFYQNLLTHVSGRPWSSSYNQRLQISDFSFRGVFYDIRDLNLSLLKEFSHLGSSNYKRTKSYMITSFGLEIFNNSLNISIALNEYERNLKILASIIKHTRGVKFIWMLLEHNYNDYTPYLYEYTVQCNNMAVEYLSPHGVLIWQSNIKIYQQLSSVMRNFDDRYIRSVSTYWVRHTDTRLSF